MKKLLNLLIGLRGVEETQTEGEPLGSLYGKLLTIAWPAALEGLLLSLMNSFDTMMVGKLGPEAIAAVGLCGQPRMILLLVAQALCVGTTAIVARRKGAGDQAAAVSCLKQSLVIIFGVGVLMTLCAFFLGEPLLRLAGSKDDTIGSAMQYFRITSSAYIFNFLSLCICAAMRGIGKTRITMVVNMTANVVNVFLNYCLIGGHLGFPALGIRGAAIATAIGGVVSCVLAFTVVLRPDGYLSLVPFTRFRFEKETLKSLVKVGSGSIAEAVLMRVGFLLTGRLIAGVSTAAYATNQIVMQVTGLSFTVGDGIASACTSLIGQSLGAGKQERAKVYVKVSERVSFFVSVLLILMMVFGRNLLPSFFTDDPEILAMGALSFVVVAFGVYHQNKRVVLSGCLRGAGDVRYVALVALVSVAIVRPFFTWLFCYPLNGAFPALHLGFLGGWLAFNIDSYVRSAMLHFRIRKGQWVNIKV